MLRTTLLLLILLIAGFTWIGNSASTKSDEGYDVGEILGGVADTGFKRATEPRSFVFPADHGPHPEFRNEWWYFTGNLDTRKSQRIGYQIVFFRNALAPNNATGGSDWRSNQTWMAHLALTDVAGQKFYAYERFSRGAKGLAGATHEPFGVWLYDWSIQENNGLWQLRAKAGDIELNLKLKPQRPPLLQGQDGLSQKSSEPGNASYYYSIPRLGTDGQITVKGKVHHVSGLSWLDREWSTSALGKDQVGWDWFSLQLSDGSDLMFYRLRLENGSADPHSSGTYLNRDGVITRIKSEDVKLKAIGWWQSPLGGRYPISWKLEIAPVNLQLTVKPVLKNQELNLLVRYWEGAVDVSGNKGGKPVTGRGYLELAGYADQAREN